jgi:hydrogenase nickel incorporation protein HypA/HybF
MHEMTIATSLLEEVLALVGQHKARRVGEVEVELGVMRLVVPESLQVAFAVVSEGTPAEGAILKLTETPLRASCNLCQNEYSAQVGDFRCPSCGQADVRITGGNDIIIKSVALDVAGSGAVDEDQGR